MDWEETTARRDQNHLGLGFGAAYIRDPMVIHVLYDILCISRLCLSISDFHPDTWNPAWSVSTILTGLLSFMVSVWTKWLPFC